MDVNGNVPATKPLLPAAKPERHALQTLAIAASGALLSSVALAQDKEIELETLRVEEEVLPDTNPYTEPGAP